MGSIVIRSGVIDNSKSRVNWLVCSKASSGFGFVGLPVSSEDIVD